MVKDDTHHYYQTDRTLIFWHLRGTFTFWFYMIQSVRNYLVLLVRTTAFFKFYLVVNKFVIIKPSDYTIHLLQTCFLLLTR